MSQPRACSTSPAPILCIGCHKADPEDGCDHCAACLDLLNATDPGALAEAA
jgi:hypothetical protein